MPIAGLCEWTMRLKAVGDGGQGETMEGGGQWKVGVDRGWGAMEGSGQWKVGGDGEQVGGGNGGWWAMEELEETSLDKETDNCGGSFI